MKHKSGLIGFLLACFFSFNVELSGQDVVSAYRSDSTHTVFLVNHGWHTGIIISRENIPDSSLLKSTKIPSGKYLEFGWGDEKFYRSEKYTIYLTLRAALWPTSSVVHVAGISSTIRAYFSGSEVIKLKIKTDRFMGLLSFIEKAFAKTQSGGITVAGRGLYGNSRFFRGSRSYYFPHTCNTWVAEALKEAGFPLTPLVYQRASDLAERMREFAVKDLEGFRRK